MTKWNPWRFAILGDKITPGSKTVLTDYAESVEPLTEMPRVVPAFAPRHHYGGTGTVHRTGTIDIVTDEHGNIRQVWFRCRELPFTVSRCDHDPGEFNPANEMFIEEITYVDLPGEESSQ